jgi:sugar phosphate isomerase/epimerase
MNRRTFYKNLAMAGASLLLPNTISFASKSKTASRLTMSTVNFRERFAQTKTANFDYAKRPLTLLEIPQYFRERFGLSQVELWSKHFESLEPAYLKSLKKALKKAKSGLVNIQFDENYQIGSPDPQKRQEAIALSLKWLAAAKYLGSGAFRVNPGNGQEALAIESLKTINQVCIKNGIVLLVENHFGIEMNPAVHLNIVNTVGKNCYTLPDFGNYDNSQRMANLKLIMPRAHQISAKTMFFDQNLQHSSYDFDACMRIAQEAGFEGIYSVEQWSREASKVSDEAIADWMIDKIKAYI